MTEAEGFWHALAGREVAEALGVDPDRGLTRDEAAQRLERHGPNVLPAEPPEHPLLRFLKQFRNVLIYVLLGAAGLTAVLGEWLDTGVILAVVVVNAVVGFIQEGKAEEALAGIRSLLSPTARVLRDGKPLELDAAHLVPGDVVRLEGGDRVPADLRIIETLRARVDEALLTGESVPVEKSTSPVGRNALPADRGCMAFSGSLVTSGRIVGIVTATGQETEVGRIGHMVSGVESVTTPLLRQIDRFGRQLSVAIVLASAAVFLVGWLLRGLGAVDAFLAVVALAVAAIPEGLPAIMTITLALGVQRMARRNAIIRRLPAVETLGAVTVICTDKTGTLTRNEMAAERILFDDRLVKVRGSGYEPNGTFEVEGRPHDPSGDPLLERLARSGLLCNEAAFGAAPEDADGDAPPRRLHGDPTEGALVVLAERVGLDPEAERERYPRIGILPFESERQWMATAHLDPDGSLTMLVKGAPERVLAMCGRAASADGTSEGTPDPEAWEARLESIAGEGYRLLALAEAPLGAGGDEAEDGLDPDAMAARVDALSEDGAFTLLGVTALMDPPRAEAADAVASCRSAGIRVIMVTGDHGATARSIGARLGIGAGDRALKGATIETASEEELRLALREHDVVARAGPEHKLRIVRALQSDGGVVAMTGDGVNDAPALKQADVGVAMGVKGTEAARGASEMVLADDNFASIERAVEEGRTVYDNLTKTILFILPTNGAEALLVLAGVGLALSEFPVTPAQILWVNMITAVTLALALSFEPPEAGIMLRPPRASDAPLLSRFLVRRIGYVSLLVAALCMVLFQWLLANDAEPAYARTAVVNALVAAQLWYLFTCRFKWKASIGWAALVGNRAALVAAGLLLLFQAAFTYLPLSHALFDTRPLALATWPPVLGVGLILYLAVELEKAAGRAGGRGSSAPRNI
jgi:magnesium-transporting ATPase (P-type)